MSVSTVLHCNQTVSNGRIKERLVNSRSKSHEIWTYHYILYINLHIDTVNYIALFWKMSCFFWRADNVRSKASGIFLENKHHWFGFGGGPDLWFWELPAANMSRCSALRKELFARDEKGELLAQQVLRSGEWWWHNDDFWVVIRLCFLPFPKPIIHFNKFRSRKFSHVHKSHVLKTRDRCQLQKPMQRQRRQR